MKCVFCRGGEAHHQRVKVERHNHAGEPVAVIHSSPAEVCATCGEEYYAAEAWHDAERLPTQSPARVAAVAVCDLQSL